MKKLLSSLLFIFATMVALPAFADDLCKNLFDSVAWASGRQQDLYKNNSGEITSISNANYSTYLIAVEPNTSYVWNGNKMNGSGINGGVYFLDGDKNWISRITGLSNGESQFTTPANCKYIQLQIGGQTFDFTNMQLERGSTATAYQPYNPLCATCQGIVKTYESATGTVAQNGTPTPTNPVEPTFYQQGDMILRKVGDYADSYDATTGKITRRVGVKVLNGTEDWTTRNSGNYANNPYFELSVSNGLITSDTNTLLYCTIATSGNITVATQKRVQMGHNRSFVLIQPSMGGITLAEWKSYLAEQYNAGHPVTVYYPLATPVEENWPSSYCAPNIKIATTAYNSARFNPVQTDLDSAVATIREIVTKTINQTAAIASLQADKQTRPEDACPAGKKCLLVETEENGVIVPHWFPIIEAPEE